MVFTLTGFTGLYISTHTEYSRWDEHDTRLLLPPVSGAQWIKPKHSSSSSSSSLSSSCVSNWTVVRLVPSQPRPHSALRAATGMDFSPKKLKLDLRHKDVGQPLWHQNRKRHCCPQPPSPANGGTKGTTKEPADEEEEGEGGE